MAACKRYLSEKYQNDSKYYTGKPLFHFGSGMSLTTFTHTASCEAVAEADTISCTAKVKNTGSMAGDEVV